ncbi:Hmx1p NDAI_0E04500 [Naumovozyma dairenensis CBS 421]|uniref:Heme oxygenase n=1 Tax=Naumovozyma dairenensis (strain ATCC 10597 / BCRC 20456 / CBS 421 / NBRC 0211 / NRRL Y-12639) TaxID=1071378 RepID=G0WBZ7_NAUDC|nr:hypothetical protein NDAI_0E04500 [Naumovozyma dairenensis CBS 421]CCD25267.1 hypothetical protein NDAI_0E04500 [Naumovozyma dairenensis CBS 421]
MSSSTVTIIPSPTDTEALANRINFHTRDAHNKIDKKMTLKLAVALRHGDIYRQGILTYYYIFQAVESEINYLLSFNTDATKEQKRTGSLLSKIWLTEFNRTDKLFKDLKLLYSDRFQNDQDLLNFINEEFKLIHQNKNSKLYQFVNFIHISIQTNPCCILAYCHVLYLALFAGGKIIKSKIYKNLGFLPNFNHLSSKELFNNATNFFQFTENSDSLEGINSISNENKLKLKFKRNFELNTRSNLNENEKLTIIEIAKQIFQWNLESMEELGQRNQKELMNLFSFKLINYLFEEWKFNDSIKKNFKAILMFVILLLLIQFFVSRSLFT